MTAAKHMIMDLMGRGDQNLKVGTHSVTETAVTPVCVLWYELASNQGNNYLDRSILEGTLLQT